MQATGFAQDAAQDIARTPERHPSEDAVQPAPQIESLDADQTLEARLRAAHSAMNPRYEDKLMDPASLPPQPRDDGTEDAPDPASAGFSSWLLESRYGRYDSYPNNQSNGAPGPQGTQAFGQHIEYRAETPNHGDWSLSADLRDTSNPGGDAGLGLGSYGRAESRSGARFTLRNTAFPLTPQRFADTAVGDIYSEVTDALSRAYRLSLGNSIVRGAATRIYDRGMDFRVGAGTLAMSQVVVTSSDASLPAPPVPDSGIGPAVNVSGTGFSNLVTDRNANWTFSFQPTGMPLAGNYSGQIGFTASSP
ncbi:MAG: hypothetical protein EOO28_08925 [Comamonadaceae bacterium]|nr:MAG: hypothetical protein EOO28_08925 [Comamonadaceae bacterium]